MLPANCAQNDTLHFCAIADIPGLVENSDQESGDKTNASTMSLPTAEYDSVTAAATSAPWKRKLHAEHDRLASADIAGRSKG